jgi:hypothetical protein
VPDEMRKSRREVSRSIMSLQFTPWPDVPRRARAGQSQRSPERPPTRDLPVAHRARAGERFGLPEPGLRSSRRTGTPRHHPAAPGEQRVPSSSPSKLRRGSQSGRWTSIPSAGIYASWSEVGTMSISKTSDQKALETLSHEVIGSWRGHRSTRSGTVSD